MQSATRSAAADQAYGRTSSVLGGRYRAFFAASIAASLLLQATIVTDTIIVGQLLGPVPMSGIRVASPIVNLLGVIAMLVGVGGSTITAIAMGRRDRKTANAAFTLTIILGIVFGLVFMLVVVPLSDPIARLISTSSETVAYTAAFLRIIAMGSPAYILASIMAMLLRTDSCVKLSSAVLAVAGIANVAFDLLFMGAFRMGVEGSAFATVAGMMVAVALSLLYFRFPKRTLRLSRSFEGNGPEIVMGTFKNGASASLRMLFACAALLFLNFVVGQSVGVGGIAFLTVCGNIQLLATAFFSAAGQAAMPMEGVLFGESDFNGLRLLVQYVFRVTFACVAALVVVVWLFPSHIVGLFVPGGIEGTDWLMRLYSLGFIPLAANYILLYHYNTVQKRSMALTLMICENLLFYMPLIWVLTNAYGLAGSVAAFVCAEAMTTAVTLVAASFIRRKEGLADVLLVPNTPREVVYEATVSATNIDASGIAHRVKEALDACGVPAAFSVRAAMGTEEMVANAASRESGKGRPAQFDVRVCSFPESVHVSLRDNGTPFDPTNYESNERGKFEIDHITALLAVASRVDYRYVLGLNQTVIEIGKGDEHA